MISNDNINDNINKLTILLQKFNSNFRYRNGDVKNISNYDIDTIVNVYTKVCKYAGNNNNNNLLKQHLVIKYMEKEKDGIICLSIPLDNYEDLL